MTFKRCVDLEGSFLAVAGNSRDMPSCSSLKAVSSSARRRLPTLMHEIAGVEAKDWQDIQGLLFREPVVASESSLDMKLDELEAKFNKIDTIPRRRPSRLPIDSARHVSRTDDETLRWERG